MKEEWKRRDRDIAVHFHRSILAAACFIRLFILPRIFEDAHPAIQLGFYTTVELYAMSYTKVFDGDKIPFTLNIWHGDHVARVIQLAVYALFVATTGVQVSVVFGIWLLHIYCWPWPRHVWIHVLTDMLLQHNLRLY